MYSPIKAQSSNLTQEAKLKSSSILAPIFSLCFRMPCLPRDVVSTTRSMSAKYVHDTSLGTNSFFYRDVNITFAMIALEISSSSQ